MKKYRFAIHITDIYEIIVKAKSKQEAKKILDDNLDNEKYDFRYLPMESDSKTVYKGIVKEAK